jgi:hypothetical protein
VFTRTSGTWTQRTKIVPADEDPDPCCFAPPDAAFGDAVDLSRDGTNALIGGDQNDGSAGAAWVYVGSGATWNEQAKLIPNGVTDALGGLGSSVALSSDGNVAAVGASDAVGGSPAMQDIGAVVSFTRSGANWTLTGSRLNGTGETNVGSFGNSVALADDGQTLVAGARQDNGGHGAVFMFAPPAPVCSSVSGTTPIGGGAAGITLSCTFPAGAHPNFSIVSNPGHGTLSGLNAGTGQLTYTSVAGFGGLDSFVYEAGDQWGLSAAVAATVNVQPLPVPTCSNVTGRGKKGATKVTLTLKCTGPAGHSFTYGIVSKPGNGKLGKINQSNGKVTYTTHIGFSGADRFVYVATDAGGSSKNAVANIVLPHLDRVTSTMGFDFDPTTAKFTQVNGMSVQNVPGGAKVLLSCKGKHCPIAKHTSTVPKHRVCKGKGKKRKCKRVEPKLGNIDLGHFVSGKHVSVGSRIFVTIVESGWIGKRFVFTILKNRAPSRRIQTLAPGSSTKLCPTC